ncbi:MAG: hypothetical protein JKY32_07265 [Rhizobiales bacterium]|nr:hypothetical protein [Hyphomicrobiales bacterium]
MGTDLQASGRWRDGNLIRWREGSLRPVGGWRVRVSSAFAAATRGAISWQDNSGDQRYSTGSFDTLYSVSASNTVTDITPATLTSGNLDAVVNTGYGGSFYGTSFYGTSRPDTGNFSEATTWALDTFGQFLVACSVADGTLWEWQLNVSLNAVAIANAPTGNLSLLVTEERFLFGLGAGGNPRKIQWCDREDNTTWTPAATNEAGDFELQTTGQIMAGVKTRGQALILTDVDAHSATYLGPPFVYGFERVGEACGLISRKAIVAVDRGVFWMGQNGFFQYDGSTVSELPCEIADHVFGDISSSQISKTWAVSNSQHGEIWFFYPSSSSNEVDSYAVLDYKEGHWAFGRLARTTGVDRSVFKSPFWNGTSGNLYEHEIGLNYDGDTIFAESGPVSLGSGDVVMKVTDLIPDEKTQGDVNVTFKTRFYPNDTESTHGPFSTANPTSVRFSGRQIRMRVEGVKLADWRVGIMRVEAKPGGRR